MRSLYVAIFAVMLGVLTLSYVVFRGISDRIEKSYFDPVFDRFDQLELESARSALQSGGGAALSAYLLKLDTTFSGTHRLANEQGIDLLSGADLRDRLPRPPAVSSRLQLKDRMIITRRSTDGHFWLITVAAIDRSGPPLFLNYYFVIAGVIVILYWLAAVGLVLPIRRVSRTADQFGRGEFGARVELKRKDEIGILGDAFNRMADRIETLITSERRLMQDISHELRSPLTRLKLATKLARTSPDQQTALDRIERDVDRMTVLLWDLLDITRMEGDPSTVNFASTDLDALTRSIVSDCSIEADMRGCALVLTGTLQAEIEGDRELLRRAIENVVRNAIRYCPRGETIDIHMTDRSGNAVIDIRDHGPGVEEQFLTAIFEPFFRTDAARQLSNGGTGLGLAIAKRAVQLHTGTIQANNAGPGLQVTMTLPITRDPS